ncbi:MAG TPA: SUMF1/EgtB/PvdO family nonheme iron enzyme [Stellaceae bacterium]|nr:SUMF1/EgtB/PvdO family nonheme iron enzyme [Stellaceae bacterium]
MQGSEDPGRPRRLATILAADIAGYSRLVGLDEEGTLFRVRRHRRELIEPSVADHHGRIVKWMGDGFLAEFDSPVEAVRCAVVIQQSMAGRNAALARQHWIQFRIGVNLGDIVIDSDEDVYGEGVNLAARLQELCAPGGVYISGGIYELVKNKLVVGYQSLGDHKVKNITEPVRVYRVLPDPEAVAKVRRTRRQLLGASALAAALLAVGGYWWMTAAPRAISELPPLLESKSGPATGETVATLRPPPTPAVPPRAEDQRRVVVPPPAAPSKAKPVAPEMVSLPGGSFLMGSNEDPSEKPIHRVTLQAFSIARYPVTVREWKACVAASACPTIEAGDDRAPMTNVSWDDAMRFVAWLGKTLNETYRLPTEAEWEFAARGGTVTRYWWGNELALGMADCKGCGEPYNPKAPLAVGSFPPNPYGLHDMTGAVAEWVADCWHHNYAGAPADGAAWDAPDCAQHVLRGGSWQNDPGYLRAASRDSYDSSVRYLGHGFRVARTP